MAIVESLLIAPGTGVAKYLAEEALPKDWQDQIAAEAVSALASRRQRGMVE